MKIKNSVIMQSLAGSSSISTSLLTTFQTKRVLCFVLTFQGRPIQILVQLIELFYLYNQTGKKEREREIITCSFLLVEKLLKSDV